MAPIDIESKALVDFDQKSLFISAASIAFNPLFWNIVARQEYNNKLLTKLFGGRSQTACYALAVTIFSLGIFRDLLYERALRFQPAHPLLASDTATYIGYALVATGNVLVLSSTWQLGITGTFLGDYFGILMDSIVTGFPFNVTDAPMYNGSTLSFLGAALIYGKPAGILLTVWVFIVYKIALSYENPFTAGIYAKRDRERAAGKETKKIRFRPSTIVVTGNTMKPTWVDETQHGSNSRRNSANPFTADYTIDQTLHGLSHTDRRRSRRLTLDIEVPPDFGRTDFIRLDTIPATPGPSETTFRLDTPIEKKETEPLALLAGPTLPLPNDSYRKSQAGWWNRRWSDLVTFGQFVGPGFMIAVAYIDPGNYATDIAAGASYHFDLLFIVLLSNIIAIFLQSLAIKLGTITGLDLATACRVFLPKWMNVTVYVLGEIAIIATDMAVVIGTATAIHLLIPKLPLLACVILTMLDVVFIVVFYRPDGSMRGLRLFEIAVCFLVLGVVVCFCIQLSLIENTTVGQVFRGYLPSGSIIQTQGLYQSCGILGATVMPHSLHLGSGVVQSRLKDFDMKEGNLQELPRTDTMTTVDSVQKVFYFPSMAAIKHCMKFSIAEIIFSLFIFALFVNSAILVVAGAALYQGQTSLASDIFGMHDLLANSISSAAGIIFAFALLLSGVSAGLVCTIAGQLVSEGALGWRMRPWLRRLITRVISITPAAVVVAVAGQSGLSNALTGTQVVLSTVLPVITAPLIYFTSFNKYMTVVPGAASYGSDTGVVPARRFSTVGVKMANSWYTTVVAVFLWLVITVMVGANLVLLIVTSRN
ncbi:metal ion transporter metal ion transporter [Colletotrichum karsti]|uniref:Phosphatidyl-N-methylethanolamine N-methyltransferase n=1 Tax=Colletotrichum karsti TaxID=1095194 RepID=A0A9P6ICP6_9PEZI|nr:metal ion transporter metal ion transporter [Colletotrichum karsti]KAF9876220.1 metal ion transporter metal ion transporter [Colletotrichum karsti]